MIPYNSISLKSNSPPAPLDCYELSNVKQHVCAKGTLEYMMHGGIWLLEHCSFTMEMGGINAIIGNMIMNDVMFIAFLDIAM